MDKDELLPGYRDKRCARPEPHNAHDWREPGAPDSEPLNWCGGPPAPGPLEGLDLRMYAQDVTDPGMMHSSTGTFAFLSRGVVVAHEGKMIIARDATEIEHGPGRTVVALGRGPGEYWPREEVPTISVTAWREAWRLSSFFTRPEQYQEVGRTDSGDSVFVAARHPRRFHLVRDVDHTGTSGTGVVVEGVEWTDGSVVIRWLGPLSSQCHYRSVMDLIKVHGHGGSTRIVWVD